MLSTGQSGNALSPHYRDWTDEVAAVQSITIMTPPRAPAGDAFDTLVCCGRRARPVP